MHLLHRQGNKLLLVCQLACLAELSGLATSCPVQPCCHCFAAVTVSTSCGAHVGSRGVATGVTLMPLLTGLKATLRETRAATAMKLALVRVNPHNPMPHLPPPSAAALPLQLQLCTGFIHCNKAGLCHVLQLRRTFTAVTMCLSCAVMTQHPPDCYIRLSRA